MLAKQGEGVSDIVAETSEPTEPGSTETNAADFVLHGALLETKITIYGKVSCSYYLSVHLVRCFFPSYFLIPIPFIYYCV